MDHTKEIFNLACEGHQLKERVTQKFAKLSNQKVPFHTQAQSTSYKMLASRHLDCFTACYAILQSDQESSEAKDKAIEELLNRQVRCGYKQMRHYSSTCWIMRQSWTHSLDRTGGWIRAQEERIWMMMVQITEDLGAPLCAGLAIVFCLLDTLPSFPENLAYQSTSPIITGFIPEAYAQCS